MKKFLIIFLFFFIINLCVFAQTTTQEKITAIENSMFGYDFKNEKENTRIERIEKHLYGIKKTGKIENRIENIQNDMGLTIQKRVEQIPTQNQNKVNNNTKYQTENIEEDNTVDYPIVDQMEETIFNESYKKENIYKRLERLEQKVFNKTSNESLNVRVDRLSKVLMPQSQIAKKQQDYDLTQEEMEQYYANRGFEQINDSSIPFQLAVLEEDLLKTVYSNEHIANRLSRLEQKLFNRTFASDTDITRLQRILVTYEAKKNSHKYENNRKMQNVAAFSNLGGILLMILAMLL